MKTKRAHEGPIHHSGKLALGQLLARRDFLVLYEHQCCDVVGFRAARGHLRIVCGEHDTTTRTVLNNLRRNFSRHCECVVILVPDESARAAIRRLLRRTSLIPANRVGIIIYSECYRQLGRIPLKAVDPCTRSQSCVIPVEFPGTHHSSIPTTKTL